MDATRFAERDVLGATGDLAPFTDLSSNVTPFQARLLDQAAVDNFDAVRKFLSDPSTVTADQLHELFTSCFMNEGLRDELFIAIYKASTEPIKGNGRACQLLQLALGHFGPSAQLRPFVQALVKDTPAPLRLRELEIRRMYVPLTEVFPYMNMCCTACRRPRQVALQHPKSRPGFHAHVRAFRPATGFTENKTTSRGCACPAQTSSTWSWPSVSVL